MIRSIAPPSVSCFKLLLSAVLTFCLLAFTYETIHWPMIGDASLMHYAVFLMERGAIPYRDIAELNLPGSYLVQWLALHALGGGDLAWRIFDLLLGFSAIAAMIVIALPSDWFAGFWAGALLLLVHGRDGIFQLGQRDFTLSVCLLAAYACLFVALRKNRPSLAFCFGFLAAFAATIKPTFLPLAPFSLLLLYLQFTRAGKSPWQCVINGTVGFTFPLLMTAMFLWRTHSLEPFLNTTRAMVIYHASLARQSFGYLLLHSISPLLPLFALWLALLVMRRRRWTPETAHLMLGVGIGLLSYLSQAKGYPYQRYPFLAFLLLWMSMDFVEALRSKGAAKFASIAALAFGGLFLAPVSTAMASGYEWRDLGTVSFLQRDLSELGSARLAGGIQCVHSIAGCTNVLYRMKLAESSDVFYDEFLFGPDTEPAVQQNRKKFWHDIQQSPPEVIVVTERLFPSGPNNYQKLPKWPEFDDFLKQRYSLYVQRTPTNPVKWWGRAEVPAGYRIYLRNSPVKRR